MTHDEDWLANGAVLSELARLCLWLGKPADPFNICTMKAASYILALESNP